MNINTSSDLQIPLSSDTTAGNEREQYILPIERLRLPDCLNGSRHWAMPSEVLSTSGAQNDMQAVLFWLDKYKDKPSTQRTCRLAAEKLLLWCIVERGHALSELSGIEINLFVNFLADTRPVHRWVGECATARTSSNWKPFSKTIQDPATIELILTNVNSLINWLIQEGQQNLWSVVNELSRLKGELRSHLNRRNSLISPSKIGLRQWVLLKRNLPDPNVAKLGQLQLLVAAELMFYAGITSRQIHELTWNDLEPIFLNGKIITWNIPVGDGHNGSVYSIGTLTDNLSILKREEKSSKKLSKSPRYRSRIVGGVSLRLHNAMKISAKQAFLQAVDLDLIDDANIFENINLPMIRGGAMHAAQRYNDSKNLMAIYGNLFLPLSSVIRNYLPQSHEQPLQAVAWMAHSLTLWFHQQEKLHAEELTTRSQFMSRQ